MFNDFMKRVIGEKNPRDEDSPTSPLFTNKKFHRDPAKALDRINDNITRINARISRTYTDMMLLKFLEGRKQYFQNKIKNQEEDGC